MVLVAAFAMLTPAGTQADINFGAGSMAITPS